MFKFLSAICILSLSITCEAQTWVQTNLTPAGVSCLAVNGNSLYAGTGNGIEMTTDNGVTWVTKSTGLASMDVTSIAIENSKMIAGTATSGVYLSVDGGANWSPISGGVLNTRTVLAVLISGANMFAGTVTAGGDGLYISSNNGTNWSKVNSGSGLNGNNIRSLGKAGNNLLCGTNGGGIYVSTDNGLTWTLSTLTGSTNGYFLSFVSNGTKTYAGNGGELLMSTNNGSTFSLVNAFGCGFYGLALNGNDLYAATQTCYGPYVSTNSGSTLTYLFNGLSNYNLTSIVICGSNLFIGSTVDGVWKFPITVATNVNEINHSGSVEIFPNPTNDQFSITLSKRDETLMVYIMDAQGQALETIQLSDNTASIDLSHLSSGIYFVKLKGKEFNETKKVVKW